MQNENSDVTAQVLLEVKDVVMHRFVNNKKSLFTTGNCKIAKIDHRNNSTVYFINMNSFYYTLRKQIVFIKLVYDQSVSYLFPHFQNGLSTLSLAKGSPSINDLEEILSNAAVLADYATAINDVNIRNKIQVHCPKIATQPVFNPDMIKETINTTGKLLNTTFTVLGGFLKTAVSKTGEYINNKIEQGQNKQVNPETKQKWQNIKKGTTNILKMSMDTYNAYVEPIVKPVFEKGKEQFGNIKNKIESSENQNVKYACELAETSQKALVEAFDGLLKGGKQVGEQLGCQTKKIVQKKLGDDYVKTFIENENKRQGEIALQERNETEVKLENTAEYPRLD